MSYDEHYSPKVLDSSQNWNRDYCTVADGVTNAYGNVRFPGVNEDNSKYVRIYYKTQMDKMMQILFDQDFWYLKNPRLLISVTGGAKTTFSTLIRDILCKGLVKAASTTSKFTF